MNNDLQAYLKVHGITILEIAAATGLGVHTLYKVIPGIRKSPKVLDLIIAYLNLDPSHRWNDLKMVTLIDQPKITELFGQQVRVYRSEFPGDGVPFRSKAILLTDISQALDLKESEIINRIKDNADLYAGYWRLAELPDGQSTYLLAMRMVHVLVLKLSIYSYYPPEKKEKIRAAQRYVITKTGQPRKRWAATQQ